jgi:putative addiction module component (TIGR02574 family)
MIRVDSIKSQIMELTPAEREDLLQWIDQTLVFSEYDHELTPEQIEEFNRRLDEIDSGADPGVPAEEVMQGLRAMLAARRRPA